ncbi:hypothetical protein ACFLIM_27320 [Nonomuraea sp. M3C6]|uniref:Uncharacterized protein n=1 Tax=Nonomuraea marmarensis TaxID=3351344 RepID=A0ABW7AHR8_9ACTN
MTTRSGRRTHEEGTAMDARDGPAQSDKTVEVRAHTAYGDITIHRS